MTLDRAEAERIACQIRRQTVELYCIGRLNRFMRGFMQGQMNVAYCFLGMEAWVREGITNEINYWCRRAQREGQ